MTGDRSLLDVLIGARNRDGIEGKPDAERVQALFKDAVASKQVDAGLRDARSRAQVAANTAKLGACLLLLEVSPRPAHGDVAKWQVDHAAQFGVSPRTLRDWLAATDAVVAADQIGGGLPISYLAKSITTIKREADAVLEAEREATRKAQLTQAQRDAEEDAAAAETHVAVRKQAADEFDHHLAKFGAAVLGDSEVVGSRAALAIIADDPTAGATAARRVVAATRLVLNAMRSGLALVGALAELQAVLDAVAIRIRAVADPALALPVPPGSSAPIGSAAALIEGPLAELFLAAGGE